MLELCKRKKSTGIKLWHHVHFSLKKSMQCTWIQWTNIVFHLLYSWRDEYNTARTAEVSAMI